MIVSKSDGHEIDLQDMVYSDSSEKTFYLWVNLVEVLLKRGLITEGDVIEMTWGGNFYESRLTEPVNEDT